MTWLASLIGGMWGYVAAAMVAAGLTGFAVHRMDEATIASLKLADQQAQTAAISATLAAQQKIDAANLDAAVKEAEAQQKIVTQTQTITKTVTIHVHDKILCPGGITFGIVRVLYAAERGLDPAAIFLPAGQSDDACAAYEPSAFASDLAADFGAARANVEQLNALQSTVRNFATEKGSAGGP
jgi:uncharacterized protein GlcG (DUF336 family)